MPPHKKEIPFDDVKGLKTLLDEGKQQGKSQESIQQEIANYFHVSTRTVRRRITEMNKLDADLPKIKRLLDDPYSGWTLSKIATHYGLNPSELKKMLNNLGNKNETK